jgi:microcystin-dependent protein
MSEPFLGEVKIISWNFPPKGWTFCNGQLLPINQNQALFSILGTTYGGDGRVTFALPNLQGRSPLHVGNGIVLGELGGESAHTLNISELPAHNHVPVGSKNSPSAASAAGNIWSTFAINEFNSTPDSAMNPAGILPAGGSQPHENMSPYLVLNFIIALQGIFPSQN